MKRFIVLFLVLVGVAFVVPAVPEVKADAINDALVESLRQQADAAEERAGIEEAKGNRVGAAQWRQTAGNIRRQAKNSEMSQKSIDAAVNAIGDAYKESNNKHRRSDDDD